MATAHENKPERQGLQEQLEMYRLIFDSIYNGAMVTDANGFISESYMKRLPINIRIDSDGLYPEFFASSDDADRYLTAVCYENLFEKFHHSVRNNNVEELSGKAFHYKGSMRNSGSPYSTG